MRSGTGIGAAWRLGLTLQVAQAALAAGWLNTGLGWAVAGGEPTAGQPQTAAAQPTNLAPPQPRKPRLVDRPDKRSLARPGADDRWLEQWRRLPPEQRQAKLKELRQKYGFGPPPAEPVPKWRQEWEALSPEQRRARLVQWRQQRAAGAELSPKEREARRQQLRARLDQAIATLRRKASNDLITIEERHRLDRLEELARRFKTSGPSPGGSAEAVQPAAGPIPSSDIPQVPTQRPELP